MDDTVPAIEFDTSSDGVETVFQRIMDWVADDGIDAQEYWENKKDKEKQ